ncbi:hypothetical protein F6Y05_19675 [Bacillus megaterium]|nr:hypothetical protein [Priestia megaterium]
MSLAHFDDISEICYACEKQPLGKRQKRIGVWTEKEMRKPVEERVENQKVVALFVNVKKPLAHLKAFLRIGVWTCVKGHRSNRYKSSSL